jgi:predicted ATPase/class 3 adenylate cyclase
VAKEAAVNIPTGTVTFLFSDVVGSTRLWAADPDAMSGSLRLHDQIFNETIAKYQGHVFSTAGDSFSIAFARASAAVECAEAIQRSMADVDWGTWPALSVRIGLHLGEAEEREANYFGPTVNHAARVMAVAHGGQCVLTDGVRDAAGISVTDLGIHTLRDIEAPVHLSQLTAEEFPPLWSVGTGIVSVPSPRTSLVGREEAVNHVRRVLAAHRLVTLTGVGGCGKTRLAIEVAYREVPSHPEGVWFVDLSPIADEVALPGAFATALRLAISTGTEPREQIATYIASRDALLVVDNCEHVIDPVAEFVDALLERSPRLRVIATSRESLEIEGEFTWKVPSLDTGHDAGAVELFVERAAAAGADLARDEVTSAAIGDVVEQLDGIPLAIELAAARTRSMSVADIRDLLDDRFSLLSGGSRRMRQRQATLEGAVQWSYDLLTPAEQSMLQTLSVFQGGFAPADVAVVGQLSNHEARNLIDALIAKSLVDVTRDASGEVRQRLLETIRLFALARLVDGGGAIATRDRHLDHFASEAGDATFAQWTDVDRIIRSGREYENFRSAITWAFERGRLDTAIKVAAMGTEAAGSRGELQLAIDILRQPADLKPLVAGFAKTVLAYALSTQGDVDGALTAVEEALAIGRVHPGDFMVFALMTKGSIAAMLGDMEGGVTLYREAQELAQDYGPNIQAGPDLYVMSWFNSVLRFDECVELGDTCLSAAPNYGWRHVVEAWRAWALLASGRTDDACRAVDLFTTVPPGSQWAHLNAVVAHVVMGHTHGPEQAARSLASTMREAIARRPGIRSDVLQGFAYLAHLRGDQERAQELAANAQPFVAYMIFSWLKLVPFGATAQDALERWAQISKTDPLADRFVRDAQHSQRLMAEELERWL